ncbi:MAG: DUF2225 domain-containing protein [Bacillota bacterium]
MEQKVNLLRKIHIFNRLTPLFLGHLAACSKVEKYPLGKTLLEAGSLDDHLFIVLHGKVGISGGFYRDQARVAGGPGTILGVFGLLGGNPASCSVRTEDDTIILTINRRDFQFVLKSHPEEAVMLIESLSGQLQKASVSMDVISPVVDTHQGTAQAVSKEIPSAAVEKNKREEKRADEPFYSRRFTCPCCEITFYSQSVKSKYVRLDKTDSDFCPHYRAVNPLFYEVRVCPQCGYAFAGEKPVKLNDRAMASLAEQLLEIRTTVRFDGERDLDVAVDSFHRAIYCLEIIGGKKSELGKFYLKIAWLYRSAGYETQEQEYCEKALCCFNESYRTEQSSDPAFELNLLYLLGDLNHRLGYLDRAAQWFSRILTHPRRFGNPNIVNRTREQWYELRAELKKSCGGT